MRAIGTRVVLAFVVATTGVAWAEDAKSPPSPDAVLKALAEAGKPGPEHKKLQSFVGDWDLTLKLWTNPSQPPAEVKATAERKWIMGGRFIQETVKGEYEGKAFEGLGLVGYDRGRKQYTVVKVCGLCGTISHSLASCSNSGTKFECAREDCCPLSGQKVKGRDEVIIESNDRI